MDQEFLNLAESINKSESSSEPSYFNSHRHERELAWKSALFEIEIDQYDPSNWIHLGELFVKCSTDFWLAELCEETADYEDSESSLFKKCRYVINALELACIDSHEVNEAIELARKENISLSTALKVVIQ